MKGCGQTNIPETDNTQLPCEEFVSTDCVIYPEAILPFGIVEDTDLTTVIKELVKRIRQNKVKISSIQSQIDNCDCEGGGGGSEECCEENAECCAENSKCCKENTTQIIEIKKEIAQLIQVIEDCCKGNNDAIQKARAEIDQLDQQFEFLSQSVGLMREGNKTQPMPVNPVPNQEYSYGGDVYYQRYEIELTGSYAQQTNKQLPTDFDKVVKLECAGVDKGGVLFLDGLQTLSNQLNTSGEKVFFELELLLVGSPSINLISKSDTNPSSETFNNEKVLIDLYYTKI